jgi:antitoxin (DNA-binding transcriptional repressor) of toxin-antitoxin stability system
MQIAIAQAKAKFADLIRKVEAGEPVIITRHGRPVAELRAAVPEAKTPLIGAMKGKIVIGDDFDTLPDDLMGGFTAPVDPE